MNIIDFTETKYLTKQDCHNINNIVRFFKNISSDYAYFYKIQKIYKMFKKNMLLRRKRLLY